MTTLPIEVPKSFPKTPRKGFFYYFLEMKPDCYLQATKNLLKIGAFDVFISELYVIASLPKDADSKISLDYFKDWNKISLL